MSLQVVVNFRVIEESDDWIVVDKPAPLIVHPANRKPEPTLLGGIEHLLAYEMENGACPAIVNRLDRDTSGLVLVAKHTAAARELGMIFERREATKEYLAIVTGWPEADEWDVRGTDPSRRGNRAIADLGAPDRASRGQGVPDPIPGGTPVRTGGRKVRTLRCFPETGRMHQIRVHLAHGGHPILGDKLYSGDGAEYLEWMAAWLDAGTQDTPAAAPPRAACRPARLAMGRAAVRMGGGIGRAIWRFRHRSGSRRDTRGCHLEPP